MDVSKVSISVVVFSATVVHALRIPHYPMVTSVIALLVIVVRIVSDVKFSVPKRNFIIITWKVTAVRQNKLKTVDVMGGVAVTVNSVVQL